jgi:acetolactate decarboxylase
MALDSSHWVGPGDVISPEDDITFPLLSVPDAPAGKRTPQGPAGARQQGLDRFRRASGARGDPRHGQVVFVAGREHRPPGGGLFGLRTTLPEARGTLVGFFSRNDQGVFTHMGSMTHIHAAVHGTRISGHVDDVVVPEGRLIRLPVPGPR